MAYEEYLKVWLRFNSSPIEDAEGNSWTTLHNPTISDTNAIIGNALQLSGGSYIQSAQKIPIGGQDFTVDFWAYGNSSQVSYACFFAFGQNYNNETGGLFFARNNSNSNLLFRMYKSGTTTAICNAALNISYIGVRHHYAFVYFHSARQVKVFVDGVLNTTISLSGEFARLERVVYVGRTAWGASQYFQGSIDEFRIFDGVALWTDDFVPPTDYFPKNLSLSFDTLRFIRNANIIPLAFSADTQVNILKSINLHFDTERKVKYVWRYENYGTATLLSSSGNTLTDLPVTKSKTGYAFYQTNRAKCFDIPTTNEIWVKFDVFTTLETRWRAYNDNSYGTTGVCSQTNGGLSFFSNNTNVSPNKAYIADKVKNQLQTVLLHMVSDSSEGIVEAWLDGEKLYTYTGNVNNGEPFADIYLQSDGYATFFSNVIISNAEIALDENIEPVGFPFTWRFDAERIVRHDFWEFRFDTARDIQISTTFTFDTRINLTVPASVNFDTLRYIFFGVNAFFDTLRYIFFGVNAFFDTNRNLAHKLIMTPAEGGIIHSDSTSTSGVQSLEINISTQQLSAQLSFTSITNAKIMQQVKGQYLDFLFDMRIEKSRKRGILTTCRCCADVDELLYTQINYSIGYDTVIIEADLQSKTFHIGSALPAPDETDENRTELKRSYASTHFNHIARCINKTPVILFKDFISDMEIAQKDVTPAGLLSELFGWTSKIPHMLINCFIYNDSLYAVQRGYEQNVIDLTNVPITLPVIDEELVRTTWGTVVGKNDTYTLNYHYFGWKIAVPPPKVSDDGKTHYSYRRVEPHGYLLVGSTTENEDGSVVEVSYSYTVNAPYELISEKSVTTYPSGSKEITVTKHNTLTPSQNHTVQYDEDGNLIGSVVGSHVAGFYNKFEDLREEYTESETKTLPGTPLFDPNFPVFGGNTLKELTEAIRWLNRKTKETISFDIFDYPHVFNLNDRIILNGNEYFVESNTAIKTPRIVNQQSLSIVRWY